MKSYESGMFKKYKGFSILNVLFREVNMAMDEQWDKKNRLNRLAADFVIPFIILGVSKKSEPS